MDSSDFYIDYHSEVANMSDEFLREVEQGLRELTAERSDMIGAAVALEKVSDTESYDVHRVRILVYKRPQDIVVNKTDPNPMIALREVLAALERQIRSSREKLAQGNSHRDSQIEKVYYDLSADEIYATYAKGWQPEDVRKMDHSEIASRLMVEQGLPQDAADFAADQILLVAERTENREE